MPADPNPEKVNDEEAPKEEEDTPEARKERAMHPVRKPGKTVDGHDMPPIQREDCGDPYVEETFLRYRPG